MLNKQRIPNAPNSRKDKSICLDKGRLRRCYSKKLDCACLWVACVACVHQQAAAIMKCQSHVPVLTSQSKINDDIMDIHGRNAIMNGGYSFKIEAAAESLSDDGVLDEVEDCRGEDVLCVTLPLVRIEGVCTCAPAQFFNNCCKTLLQATRSSTPAHTPPPPPTPQPIWGERWLHEPS